MQVQSLGQEDPLKEGMATPLQYSFLENPMNSMKRQKDRILKDELPRLVDAQYATGDQWRNNCRKNVLQILSYTYVHIYIHTDAQLSPTSATWTVAQ